MDTSLIIPAFIAGILTFLAPCTLPLVPGYLGFISGVSLNEIGDRAVRWKIVANGLLFILGFSAIFILFGTLAGALGRFLFLYRAWLTRIGGIFVIMFGLFMIHAIKLPFLQKEKRLPMPAFFKRGKPFNSFILGVSFGFGWTPCIGPVLGSILTLATASGAALQGALLLTVFSLGLALPFLLVALFIGTALKYIRKATRFLNTVSIIGGFFLIFLGILMLANRFGVWIAFFYRAFDFINYDRILDYL